MKALIITTFFMLFLIVKRNLFFTFSLLPSMSVDLLALANQVIKTHLLAVNISGVHAHAQQLIVQGCQDEG